MLGQHELRDGPKFTTADDTWYRSLIYKGKNSSDDVYCIMNPQSGCAYTSNGNLFATDGSTWIKGDGVTKITAGPGAQVNQVSKSAYGLVYVSSDGKYATLDPTATGFQPVADSCATSMGAVAIKSLLG